MATGRLRGRIALVTGASSGLGRAISLAFASEGANICCVDLYDRPRNPTNAATGKADDFNNRLSDQETTVEELTRLHGPGRAIHVKANITIASKVEAAVATCVQKFGRLDIVSNTAGISVESTHPQPLGVHETTEEDWDKTMNINAKGVFLGCKYAIQQFLAQDPLLKLTTANGSQYRGWIINTSSVQGLVAYTHTPSYVASKHAVAGLTKQIALDYAKDGIRCNAICPGFLKTTMTQNLQNDEEKRAEVDRAHPLGGMGDVRDVAKAAVFLASEDAAWVTGVTLPVDGGYMTL
jgi:NAD(P)-dependent dehydrogenase (short-subunit alcohol dehydrogenase family)